MVRTKAVARYSLHFVVREDLLITAEMFQVAHLQREARFLHKIKDPNQSFPQIKAESLGFKFFFLSRKR